MNVLKMIENQESSNNILKFQN